MELHRDNTENIIGPRSRRLGRAVPFVAIVLAAVFSVCGVLLSGSATFGCDSVVIPAVGIDRCAVAGDQPEIDGGNVVRVDRLSTDTVHWLAGHRTSHGGAFRDLTGVQLDDVVVYRGMQYRVVDYRLVDRFHADDVAIWSQSTTPSVVLQTSESSTLVHVWLAVAFAPAAAVQPAPPEQPAPEQPAPEQPAAVAAAPSDTTSVMGFDTRREARTSVSRLIVFM